MGRRRTDPPIIHRMDARKVHHQQHGQRRHPQPDGSTARSAQGNQESDRTLTRPSSHAPLARREPLRRCCTWHSRNHPGDARQGCRTRPLAAEGEAEGEVRHHVEPNESAGSPGVAAGRGRSPDRPHPPSPGAATPGERRRQVHQPTLSPIQLDSQDGYMWSPPAGRPRVFHVEQPQAPTRTPPSPHKLSTPPTHTMTWVCVAVHLGFWCLGVGVGVVVVRDVWLVGVVWRLALPVATPVVRCGCRVLVCGYTQGRCPCTPPARRGWTRPVARRDPTASCRGRRAPRTPGGIARPRGSLVDPDPSWVRRLGSSASVAPVPARKLPGSGAFDWSACSAHRGGGIGPVGARMLGFVPPGPLTPASALPARAEPVFHTHSVRTVSQPLPPTGS